MAQPASQIRQTYPLPAYNYRVTLLNVLGDGTGAMSFSEVSGLELQYDPVVYRDGFSFLAGPTIIPGPAKEVHLTLKRGLVARGDYLYRWLIEGNTSLLPGQGRRDVVIDLCDETGLPVIRWTVYGALPTRLSAPDFTADSNQVAIESLELLATSLRLEFSL